MSILDYDTFFVQNIAILQQLSSFIDWAENLRYRYIENSFHIHIVNKLRSQKVIQKFLTWNQLVSTRH